MIGGLKPPISFSRGLVLSVILSPDGIGTMESGRWNRDDGIGMTKNLWVGQLMALPFPETYAQGDNELRY